MKIHHAVYSSNARKAVFTALHLGLDVELIPVDLTRGAHKAPGFLALNPNGAVPVLEDGDFVLTESHAIMTYLADQAGADSLYPREPKARANVQRWMFWSSHHWSPAVSVLNFERVVKSMLKAGEPDAVRIERGEQDLTRFAAVLETALDGRPWLAGNDFTLADIAVATPLMAMIPARLPLAAFPRLLAWFARVQELDAWKRAAG